MVLSLAKNAVKIKCGFENAVMTGNYECAYACGILSASMGIEQIKEYDSIKQLKDVVLQHADVDVIEKDNIKRIVQMLNDYEPSEILDSQMKELYSMGYKDKNI